MNQYDTQAMAERFSAAGYEIVPFKGFDCTDDSESAYRDADYASCPDATACREMLKPDIAVINTCTVTGTGDKKSMQAIRRAARNGAEVIVAGCLAQRSADRLINVEGVRLVVGTQRRGDVVGLFEKAMAEECTVNAVDELAEAVFEPLTITGYAGKTKAVLKIQEGCNNKCSYCIIPSVRGPVRSSPLDKVISDAELLAGSGYDHIVLTGVHIMSYGSDFSVGLVKSGSANERAEVIYSSGDAVPDLADAIQAVAKIPEIKRISLGSLEPPLTEDFIIRMKNDKLCPNFHVSAQSGSSSVLARMKRKYTASQYKAMVELLRRHFENPVITTDIIVGFPEETEEEFEETVTFVKEVGFAHVHVFPFSPRIGTEAAGWKQVDRETVLRRKQKLFGIEGDS